jgi:CRP-like cAMP-binding protein
MNNLSVKNAMNAITQMDEIAWADFEQYLTTHTIKKGELLWAEGEVIKQIIFIHKGAIRYFYYNDPDDKEVTAQFFFENTFLTDYESFTSQVPTNFNFQALEDCEYTAFPRVVLYQMYDKYKYFERLGRLIAEYNFIGQQKGIRDQKNMNPEAKYLRLIKERPKVMARIPINMIASYLAVTPEHLSRIRKKVVSE